MKSKKIFLLLGTLILTLLLSIFVIGKVASNVNASVPSGYTLDTSYDEISIRDLTFNGRTNQMAIRENKDTNVSFSKTNANGSLVFKLKYDVVDASNSDSVAFRIHFDVADDQWDSKNSVWFRGDGIYLNKYDTSKSSFNWSKKSALSAGLHTIEFGRIALYKNGSVTGNYYVYYKVDGVEIDYTVNPYDVSKMDGTMFINISSGNTQNKLYDVSYNAGYEAPDTISISDLQQDGASIGEVIKFDAHHTYTYEATAPHKSVILSFIYDVKDQSSINAQFHLSNGWLGDSHGGVLWLRNDKTYISKVGSGYVTGNPIATVGLHEIEMGKLYITSGSNSGQYYLYIKIDGAIKAEYTLSDMPDIAALFTTGTNGDFLYDTDYMPIEMSSDLYVYKWDASKSGIEFNATFNKALVDMHDISEVGYILSQAGVSNSTTKIQGKFVASGTNYTVKAAVASIKDENITQKYNAQIYYVMNSSTGRKTTYYSQTITSSFYDEMDDLSQLSESVRTTLTTIKNKVLNVTLDEDDCTVSGATKTGDFSSSTIVLTGANSSYQSYYLNGALVENNDEIWLGYIPYKVAISSNKITLTKLTKEIMWGGSEHFVTLNSGHDENMTAETLSPMCTELGLSTVRFDIYFENLFSLSSNNELTVKNAYAQKIRDVINELKTNGGVTDFLAVFWVIQPNGFKTWEGKPWGAHTCPDPDTQQSLYLEWLELNGKAAQMTAELFPEINNYETWNEPEIVDGSSSPLCQANGTPYDAEHKARILTDLMYYYNEGIKKSNPNAVLSTPALCCAQNTNDSRFPVTTVNFLELMYACIKDDTPVPGRTLDKEANNYFQAINCHPYLILGVTTSNWTTFINNLHNVSVANDDAGTPIWVTEFGFAQNRTSNVQSNFLNVLGQAKNSQYITKFYFYKVHDYTSKIDDDRWGLYNYDGTIKAIGTAVKNYINPAN